MFRDDTYQLIQGIYLTPPQPEVVQRSKVDFELEQLIQIALVQAELADNCEVVLFQYPVKVSLVLPCDIQDGDLQHWPSLVGTSLPHVLVKRFEFPQQQVDGVAGLGDVAPFLGG